MFRNKLRTFKLFFAYEMITTLADVLGLLIRPARKRWVRFIMQAKGRQHAFTNQTMVETRWMVQNV